ncbi:hypothetical protein [Azospirillum sp.]|uniref:hypothetical protein n=1 Tax=Azospirillum sp. TaxID=34012 RepID=UPI003D708415
MRGLVEEAGRPLTLWSKHPWSDIDARIGREIDQATIATWFQEKGGFLGVADAPSRAALNMLRHQRFGKSFAAGLIMTLLLRMHVHHRSVLRGGSSVGKAISILTEFDLPHVPSSAKALWTAWREHGHAAHLCAAFADTFLSTVARNNATVGMDPAATADAIIGDLVHATYADIEEFLSLALLYQNFGLHTVPNARDWSWLDESAIWRVPQTGQVRPLRWRPRPLPPKLLQVAMEKQEWHAEDVAARRKKADYQSWGVEDM